MERSTRLFIIGLIGFTLIILGYFFWLHPQKEQKKNTTPSSVRHQSYDLENKKKSVKATIDQGIQFIDGALKDLEPLPE